MQIKHSVNLINLQGWPKPAGGNSGGPVGSVVRICSAIALRWFICLIGMNLKILFSPLVPITHSRRMRCLLSSKGRKKHCCQFSLVRSGLTFETLDAQNLYGVFDTSMRQSEGWSVVLLSFTAFSFPLNLFRVTAGITYIPACNRRERSHAN